MYAATKCIHQVLSTLTLALPFKLLCTLQAWMPTSAPLLPSSVKLYHYFREFFFLVSPT